MVSRSPSCAPLVSTPFLCPFLLVLKSPRVLLLAIDVIGFLTPWFRRFLLTLAFVGEISNSWMKEASWQRIGNEW